MGILRQDKHRQGGNQTNNQMRVRTWIPYNASQRVRTPRGRAWSLEPGAWSLEPGAWSLEPCSRKRAMRSQSEVDLVKRVRIFKFQDSSF